MPHSGDHQQAARPFCARRRVLSRETPDRGWQRHGAALQHQRRAVPIGTQQRRQAELPVREEGAY